MNRHLLCFTAMLFSVAAVGATPERAVTLNDFAYGYALETPGAAAVYAFPLPVEVYRHLQRDDFGDLRVFNAQGQVVPHALLPPVSTQENPARVPLPIFPVRGVGTTGSDPIAVRIQRNARGTIIDVRNDMPSVKDKPVEAYILDASQMNTPLAKLIVQWPVSEGFVTAVSVSASDDLNYWRAIKTSATLAELVHRGERLKRDTIEFAPVKAKYLRLTWNPPGPCVEITSIEAEPAAKTQAQQPVWVTLVGTRKNDKDGRPRLVFDTDGRYPVDRVNVVFSDRNSLARATIYSRSDEMAEWRRRCNGLFYRLNRDGGEAEFRNDPVVVGRTIDRFWRIDVESEGEIAAVVKLEIGWVPDRVTFLARGTGPYQLAYGSVVARKAEQPVGSLLRALDRDQTKVAPAAAIIGGRIVLGGEDRLREGPVSLPWKRILLWAVLVGGVALLAAMALGLVRQMAKAP